MLKISGTIYHDDTGGEEGPIIVDLIIEGMCCHHEVAVYLALKAKIDEIVAMPIKQLPYLDKALADMALHCAKTGTPWNRGKKP